MESDALDRAARERAVALLREIGALDNVDDVAYEPALRIAALVRFAAEQRREERERLAERFEAYADRAEATFGETDKARDCEKWILFAAAICRSDEWLRLAPPPPAPGPDARGVCGDNPPPVCPGCHAVGEERCAPGCIDAEIEAEHRHAIESGDYDRTEEE